MIKKEFYKIELPFRSYDIPNKPHFQYDNYDDASKMFKRIVRIVRGNSDNKKEWLREQLESQNCYGNIPNNRPIRLIKTLIITDILDDG